MNIQQTTPTPKLVTMIPADPQMAERDLRKKHLRVAPYCRVSTDKEEQLSSYEAQIEYYTEKIDANPDWTMVRLYADEGITGTSAKKRKDFLQMIRDCERGKIDLVITKSVSRFCRNTLSAPVLANYSVINTARASCCLLKSSIPRAYRSRSNCSFIE